MPELTEGRALLEVSILNALVNHALEESDDAVDAVGSLLGALMLVIREHVETDTETILTIARHVLDRATGEAGEDDGAS